MDGYARGYNDCDNHYITNCRSAVNCTALHQLHLTKKVDCLARAFGIHGVNRRSIWGGPIRGHGLVVYTRKLLVVVAWVLVLGPALDMGWDPGAFSVSQ